jgi:hypothetical protein
MKFGARSGFGTMHVCELTMLCKNGRVYAQLGPINNAMLGPTEILECGDSSAPVLDQAGTTHGMITAKFGPIDTGMMAQRKRSCRRPAMQDTRFSIAWAVLSLAVVGFCGAEFGEFYCSEFCDAEFCSAEL